MVEGELGLEMYFIIDGYVEIVKGDGNMLLNTLTVGSPIGEMALLNQPCVRGASARAKTDVSLAVLSLDDFNFVMKKYP